MRNIARNDLEMSSNSMVYNRLLKRHRADSGDICCSYCQYHRCENASSTRYRKHTNWKRLRKTQYYEKML
jgi:hypothetical protein